MAHVELINLQYVPQHFVLEGIRLDEHFPSSLGAVIALDKIYRQLTIRR